MSPQAAMSNIEMKSSVAIQCGSFPSQPSLVDGRCDDDADAERGCAHKDCQRHVLLLVDLFPKVIGREPVNDHEEDHEDSNANGGKGERAQHVVQEIRVWIHHLPPE